MTISLLLVILYHINTLLSTVTRTCVLVLGTSTNNIVRESSIQGFVNAYNNPNKKKEALACISGIKVQLSIIF